MVELKRSKYKLQPINMFHEMNSLENYDMIQKLGQGTFGIVQKARCKSTKQLVAIKQLLNHSAKEGFPITAMREITILKQLDNINILKIVDMIYEEPKVSNPQEMIHQRGSFYTVSPYMSSDLVGLLENPNIRLNLPQIKCLMNQLLHGVQYIHEQKYLHRDIKAANILIDFNGVLKIADFGLARIYHGNAPKLGSGPGGGERNYTGLVVTRWYRPPELLLGERKYTTAVDLWGIGCVFGELFNEKPILVGSSDAHQANLVFNLIGSPSSWPHAADLPNKQEFNLGLTCKRTLEERFSKLMPPDAVGLLSGFLTLDPYKRMNALDALNHKFFKNEPLPLKPEELPKFEESHEIDKEKFKQLKAKGNSENFSNAPNKHFRDSRSYSRDSHLQNDRNNRSQDQIRNRTNDSYVPIKQRERSSRDIRYHEESNSTNNHPLRDADTKSMSYSGLRDRSPQRSRINNSVRPPVQNYSNHQPKFKESPYKSQVSLSSSASQPKISSKNTPPSKTSGIFMTSARAKRPKPVRASEQVTKRIKNAEEVTESDLTDFDEDDRDDKEQENLDKFLDWDKYSKSPDYRKYLFEKRHFEKKNSS